VITLAQRGQASASASPSNSCSGVTRRSALLLNVHGAISVKPMSTRSHQFILPDQIQLIADLAYAF
jgi:hypothetical protein